MVAPVVSFALMTEIDAGFCDSDWSSLDDLARGAVEHHAQLRKVIPTAPDQPNAYRVDVSSAPARENGPYTFTDGEPQKVTRLRVVFEIDGDQSHDRTNIEALVRTAAARLAQLEDLVLAYGKKAAEHGTAPDKVEVHGPGILTSGATETAGATPLIQLKECVRTLNRANRPGPYNAVLGFDARMSLVMGSRDHDLDAGRRILGSVEAGIAQIPAESEAADGDHVVAAFVPDSSVLDLVWTQRPQIAHVATADGNMTLRLEEAFVLRVKDPKGIAIAKKGE